jgi:hypothetical protein
VQDHEFRGVCAAPQADYIVLWALPAAAAAAAAGAPSSPDQSEGSSGVPVRWMGMPLAAVDAAAAEAALLPGVYALYGACSPAEVRC